MKGTNWQGPFVLSLICALVDGLKKQTKPNSARFNRLAKVEDAAFRAIDFYPPANLTPEVCGLADEFFGKIEGQFIEVMGGPADV